MNWAFYEPSHITLSLVKVLFYTFIEFYEVLTAIIDGKNYILMCQKSVHMICKNVLKWREKILKRYKLKWANAAIFWSVVGKVHV